MVWILEYPSSNSRRFVKYDPNNTQYATCSGIENSKQIVSSSMTQFLIIFNKYLVESVYCQPGVEKY